MRTSLVLLAIVAGMRHSLSEYPSRDEQIPHTVKILKSAHIVDGHDSAPGAWPWQVAVSTGNVLCGGVLLSDEFVLTAAHCVSDTDLPISIVAGSHELLDLGHNVQTRTAEAFPHPAFNRSSPDQNDIALLKLTRPIKLDQMVRPATIAKQNMALKAGDKVTVVGWGYLSGAGFPPERYSLQERTLRVSGGCDGNESIICAVNPPIDTTIVCKEDAGGPLMAKRDRKWIVYGLIMNTFCEEVVRSIRISNHLKWIKRTISINVS